MNQERRADLPLLTVGLAGEHDLVLVRQRARAIAELLEYGPLDQTRIASAVSEVARSLLRQRNAGRVRYLIRPPPVARLVIVVEAASARRWREPSSAEPHNDIRAGGGDLDIARRLMDLLEVDDHPTPDLKVVLEKDLPPHKRAIDAIGVSTIAAQLAKRPPESLLEELHQQHQELLGALADLNRRQEALEALNAELQQTNQGVLALYSQVTRELDDTNRGVLALYAQLDDQARELQRLNALKNQFLSHLSHEFRTPLNSTLALSRLLIAESDGPLNLEQQNQVRLIHHGATELLGMVNDLLDLAKIEAGHLQLRPEPFSVETLFSALRGLFRPLIGEGAVRLVFVDPPELPELDTDQTKVAQILRNLITNALKFTVAGEVTVSARSLDSGELQIEVRDTGIGIEPEALDLIFEEYMQVDGPLQRRAGGTGLGLPLSAKLAALLGGRIDAESEPGVGSVFTLTIPLTLPAEESLLERPEPTPAELDVVQDEEAIASAEAKGGQPDAPNARSPRRSGVREAQRWTPTGEPVVLLVDDDEASRYLVEHLLEPAGCHVAHARSGRDGLELARSLRPSAIILDLGLPDISGVDVLAQLKGSDLDDVPIVIYTSRRLDEEEHRFLSGLALHILRKDDPLLEDTLTRLGSAITRAANRYPASRER